MLESLQKSVEVFSCGVIIGDGGLGALLDLLETMVGMGKGGACGGFEGSLGVEMCGEGDRSLSLKVTLVGERSDVTKG